MVRLWSRVRTLADTAQENILNLLVLVLELHLNIVVLRTVELDAAGHKIVALLSDRSHKLFQLLLSFWS